MLPVSFAAIIFTLGLSVFLNTSFHGFKDYNHQLKDLTNWQETSLASAKRVSAESSTLLSSIKKQLNTCLEEYSVLNESQRQSFQCETDFDSSFEDFKKSLKANYQNQLNTTIKYGLNPSKNANPYESYDYKLYHSDKLPNAFKKGDELYNSTLVKASHLSKEININDFDYFLDSQTLNIDSQLLKGLVGKDNASLVLANPAQFNINISANDFLKEETLPNALKLSINFKKRQSIKTQDSSHDKDLSSLRGGAEAIPEEKVLTQDLYSVGQLRLNEANVTVTTVVCNKCDCPGYPACPDGGGGPTTPVTNVFQQQITFNQFDNVSGRGIFFDNSQPASAINQINIVNTNQGRFTSVYPTHDNFLQVSIGTIPKTSSVLTQNTSRTREAINPQLVNFATVTFTPAVPNGHDVNVVGSSNISVDIVPRARKRYMTAQKNFYVNGKLIPKGSILVGTIEPNSPFANPQLKDLSTIRVYDQNTGALRQIFKPGDRNMNECANQACMAIDQFSKSRPAVLNLPGSDVVSSFSTRDLFSGKQYHEANRLFTLIQRDLEVNSVTGLYARNHDWQKIIVEQDLNDEQQVLLTQIFEENDSSTPTGQLKIAELLGYDLPPSSNATQNRLYERIKTSFVEFAKEKLKALNFPTGDNKSVTHRKKEKFLAYRSIYQDLLKNKINNGTASNKLLSTDIKYKNQDDSSSSNSTTKVTNSQGNSSNTNTSTKPNPPVAPNCLSKKPKNRSNKCKKNIKQYKKLLASYQATYG